MNALVGRATANKTHFNASNCFRLFLYGQEITTVGQFIVVVPLLFGSISTRTLFSDFQCLCLCYTLECESVATTL